MCTKFRSHWSTGSYETHRFSKNRTKRYRHFGESRKQVKGLSGPNSLKLSQFSHQCLNSIPTKFRFDWTTGSYKKIRFSTSFEALLSQLWRKSKKGQSLRSGSRDWVYQIVWNFDTFKINILTQCVFMLIFVDKVLFEHSCCQLHDNVFRLRFIGVASY